MVNAVRSAVPGRSCAPSTRVRRIAAALLVPAAALLVSHVPAASGVVGSAPRAAIQTNGDVMAIARAGDRVFLGGSFTRVGEPTGGGADLARAGGAPDYAFAKPNANVNAVVSDGAGGWFIGGAFTRVGGVARNRLAHLLADGSVDPAFDPNVAGSVDALLLAGGTLYAGGQWTTVNGTTTRNRLAAFDVATGQATSFHPSINNSRVQALALDGTTLYAAGGFTSVGSPAVTRNRIAAFDTTTGAPTSFHPNVNSNVAALAVAGGTLYAGGAFTSVNSGPAVTRNRLAAFDTATGTALASFDPNVGGMVNALAVAGGRVYAGGAFSTVNGGASSRSNLAAFDAAGGQVVAAFDPNAGATVSALAVAGTTVYAGGAFTQVKGGTARNRLAAFDAADGSVVAGFDPNLDESVLSLAVAGTRIYAGGTFNFAGAGTVRNRLAATNPDGTLDAAFDPNVGGPVRALAVAGGRLYAGGDFTTVNATTSRNRLAAFDAATGAVVAGFDPDLNGAVNALAAGPGVLYAGGAFTQAGGGALTRNRLAAFDLASGAATGFDPNAGDEVRALRLDGATLYAGGSFTTVNAPAVPRRRLAALDAATGAASAWDPSVNEGAVNALELSDSVLYAGGSFTTVNQPAVGRARLAAFDRATAAATSFDPRVNNGSVGALALAHSVLYAGGDFTTLNSPAVTRNRLAAVDAASGSVHPAFDPNLNGAVAALLADGPRLLAGGSFTTAGGEPRSRFARFDEPPVPGVVTGAASAVTESSATLAGTVDPNGHAATYTFEYGPTLAFGSISPPDDAGLGDAPLAVAADLTGLSPSTTYYYRLVATSSAGTSFGAVRSLRTGPPLPPAAVTLAAGATSATAAELHGEVNPNGLPASATFEYGTTTAFGQISSVAGLGDGTSAVPVAAGLTDLQPGTTYLYRVVATSAAGTTAGAVRSFSTPPAGTVAGSTPDAAVETNSQIEAIARVGDRVYIGGAFTRAGIPTGGGADLSRGDGAPNFAVARPDGAVHAVVADGAGGWFVGGEFRRLGGVARNRVGHVLADGSVDPAFDPNVGGVVNALALSGGTLYVGGSFTAVNGATARSRLAAFDVQTGVATSFHPSVNNAPVLALALAGDTLYAGGDFTSVGSPAVTRNRLAGFDVATGAVRSANPDVSAAVNATVNGGTPRNRLAAFDAVSGSVDASFDPDVNGTVHALAAAGGALYAGGRFTAVNGATARSGLAALDLADGTARPGFAPALSIPNSTNRAMSLAVADGTVYAGGNFTLVGGTTIRNRIAAFDASSGALVAGFDPNLDGIANALAVQGTRVYAGGSFEFAGAGTIRNRLAAVRPDGTLDPDFDPNVSSTVEAIAADEHTVYAGGGFNSVNGGVPRSGLAAFDATTGAVDPAFVPTIAGPGVQTLALSADRLYAGGTFSASNGPTTLSNLVALHRASGALDAAFAAGAGNAVNALALAGGTLYAGGTFSTVDGGAVTRNRVAAFDATTGAVAPLDPNLTGTVHALVLADGTLYVGGDTLVAGPPRRSIVAVDTATGAAVPGFDPGVTQEVRALALAGTTLYAGGGFTTVNGGLPRNRLAAFDTATGLAEPGFDPNVADSVVSALAASSANVYAGGTFSTVGGRPVRKLARFSAAAPGAPPSALTGAVTARTDTTAALSGTVVARQLETSYVFEYGTSLALGSISPPAGAGASDDPVAVAGELTGLSPNTTYYYRLVATNALGTSLGVVRSLRTTGPPQPPLAVTLPVISTGVTSAVLAAQVNPNGRPTSVVFEFGRTTSFSGITDVVALGDADVPAPVSVNLQALSPDRTYVYRVVATNADGTTFGEVRSFTTLPAPPP